MKDIKVELGNVQKTLLLPLWGRAVETQKKDPLLVDKYAVDIIHKMDYDFSQMEQNYSASSQLSWVIRCINVDKTLRSFLERYPDATIVNIGCGLDTTFDRVDNGKLMWYELDLPDTMALREKLIPENARRKNIISSAFDYQWFDKIQIKSKVFFMICGVLYYFEEEQVKEFLVKMAERFPGGQMIFDTASPAGIKVLNKSVIKGGGMDENSFLKWGLKQAKDLEKWSAKIEILEEYPYYANFPKKNNIDGKTKFMIWLSGCFKLFSMVHLKFK